MQADPRQDPEGAEELLRPGFWLAWGLDWPGGSTAEAVIAVAPSLIPRDTLSYSAQQILACADLYAQKRAERVVLFADLTRLLTAAGESWENLRVDWKAGLRELEGGPFPGIFLSVSEHAYMTVCDSTPGSWTGDRALIREAIARQLEADWPPTMRNAIEAGRVRRAS
jgi:hypothetical protein